MPSVNVAKYNQTFTANGGTDGYITVASNAGFYPNAIAYICCDTRKNTVYITDLVSTNKVGVRIIPDTFDVSKSGAYSPTYGRSDVSAYTTAGNAAISQPAQAVRVDQPTFSKRPYC